MFNKTNVIIDPAQPGFDQMAAGEGRRDARRQYTLPTALQPPRPVTMSAGGSPKGRAFAAHAADFLFEVVQDMNQARDLVASVGQTADAAGTRAQIFTISHVVCRETTGKQRRFTSTTRSRWPTTRAWITGPAPNRGRRSRPRRK